MSRWLLLGALLSAACGPSPECVGLDPARDLMPLAVGNTWQYDESGGPQPGVITKTVTNTEFYEDQSTHVWETVQSNSTVRKRGNWVDDGERVLRVRQQSWENGRLLATRTYRPGFLRIDRSLEEVGDSRSESHVRTEYDGTGTPVIATHKHYEWRVEAIEEIIVPAGRFSTVRISRVDLDDGEVKTYWYTRGVGKVREVGPVETEALTHYERH